MRRCSSSPRAGAAARVLVARPQPQAAASRSHASRLAALPAPLVDTGALDDDIRAALGRDAPLPLAADEVVEDAAHALLEDDAASAPSFSLAEAVARRRCWAVISHPDAGKTVRGGGFAARPHPLLCHILLDTDGETVVVRRRDSRGWRRRATTSWKRRAAAL